MTYNPDHHPAGDWPAWYRRECVRAYHAMHRALEDGRWADALAYAVAAETFDSCGHGGDLPADALAELSDVLDGVATINGTQVRDPSPPPPPPARGFIYETTYGAVVCSQHGECVRRAAVRDDQHYETCPVCGVSRLYPGAKEAAR